MTPSRRSTCPVCQAVRRPTQRHDADCLPAAVAGVLEVPLELLPEVAHDSADWIGDYNAALREGGWPFCLITAAVLPVLDGRWIAVVPSLTQPAPTKHAVVMDGHRLHHDPGRDIKYTTVEPGSVKCAIYVVATGPGRVPRADPLWRPKELLR